MCIYDSTNNTDRSDGQRIVGQTRQGNAIPAKGSKSTSPLRVETDNPELEKHPIREATLAERIRSTSATAPTGRVLSGLLP